jgi:hypothetical protein
MTNGATYVTPADQLRNATNVSGCKKAILASGVGGDAWKMMEFVLGAMFSDENDEFTLDHIKSAANLDTSNVDQEKLNGLLKKTWTIRHYTGGADTPPIYGEIISSYQLAEMQQDRRRTNTNLRDWKRLGNIGFVFCLVAIDGMVPSRGFLSKSRWYAEWDLQDVTDCWFSRDYLEDVGPPNTPKKDVREKLRQSIAYRGSATEVVRALAWHLVKNKISGGPEKLLEGIDGIVKGSFELKIPGPKPVNRKDGKPDWKPVR